MKQTLAEAGVPLLAAYYCPHLPDAGCACRKPLPGMLEQAAREHELDLARSVMIGDKPSDVDAGRAAGCYTALLARDWPTVLSLILSSMETSWKS